MYNVQQVTVITVWLKVPHDTNLMVLTQLLQYWLNSSNFDSWLNTIGDQTDTAVEGSLTSL